MTCKHGVQNGRTRSGWVFKCRKGLKKLFRKTSRWYSNNVSMAELSRLLSHFKLKNMNAFWNTIRRRRRSIQAKTTLLPSSFSNHYRGIMSCNDEVCVSSNDSKIRERVHEVHNVYNNMQFTQHVSSDDVDKLINNLYCGCSPGMDGISSEHLIYGKSDKLLSLLSSFFTVILSRACVPTSSLSLKSPH